MTFNPNADLSGNRARRSGRGAVVAGGSVIGLGGIAALVLALLTGGSFDVSQLLGPEDQQQTQNAGGELEGCLTGADANTDDACRLAGAQVLLDEFWAEHVSGYIEPGFVIVDGSTSTPCGTASNATGPFYCPPNQTIYIDPTFFQVMRQQFGAEAGRLAQLYVVGHEWGHHIQNITGIMDRYPNNGTGPDSNGVHMELQADCFAGGWIKDISTQTDSKDQTYLQPLTTDDIRDALDAASAVGDDHIQEQSGSVNPESWTHGSSQERQEWFAIGYTQGINACNTFD